MARHNKQQIDPKNLRKAYRPKEVELSSEIISNFTFGGYTPISLDTNNFEIRELDLPPGCSTPVFFHEKKVRTYICLQGFGLVSESDISDHDSTETVAELQVGSTFVCNPGKKYRVSASNHEGIHLMVVQDAKYESRLTEVSPAIISEIGYHIMNSGPRNLRSSSKAAQQQKEISADRGREGASVTASGLPSSYVPEGINAMPVFPE